ncbi:MAG: hypothetical protein LUF92_07950 [Clostridiales bacterium]|nr:hypothetical protein [Clostridiales bacterium]
MKAELVPIVMAHSPISTDVPHFDYLVSFINSTVFGLLQHWNEKNKDIGVKELSTVMQDLVLHGVVDYIEVHK